MSRKQDYVQDPFIAADVKLTNTCNFACVYCGPDLSSHWASRMDDTRWTIGEQNLKLSKDYIFNHLDTVKHVYLAGGEPLLMKDNHELLTHLYKVNPDVEIRINSNISNIHGPVFNQLQKFKNVKWTISVESTEAYFEYMRWPGQWDEFVKNALTIKQYVGDQINFNMVWCILNPFEIFESVQGTDKVADRVRILQENESYELKTILQAAFRPDIKFDLPIGAPPYTPSPNPAGVNFSPLRKLKAYRALSSSSCSIA
jgi:sulfatase maturation enzyme AslB (radical SAM superfamily)